MQRFDTLTCVYLPKPCCVVLLTTPTPQAALPLKDGIREFLRVLFRSPSSKIGAVILLLLVAVAIFAPAIALPEAVALNWLPRIAVAKPPYRLQQMSMNSAAPARIDGISVLIWRHSILGQSAIELHTAAAAVETVKAKLMLAVGMQLADTAHISYVATEL